MRACATLAEALDRADSAHGSVEQVRLGTERFAAILAGERALSMLPARNMLPDAPVENVIEMYRYVAACSQQAEP